ncbi:MAG: AAA family ATPase [Neomegalonema sp.]|nr:AAA family ATPase [Neomegalonema sp.]
MRLRRFCLTRYGHFTDRCLDFGEGSTGAPGAMAQPDLHVIYGDNESGKSTVLHGLLDLLFGIETRSAYNFLHEYKQMQLDADLQIAGGTGLAISRVKARSNTLLDASGAALGEGALEALLHGLDRRDYQAMFSLNDERLAQGGEDILASRGELGPALFSASSGLGEMAQRLRSASDQSQEFWGRKQNTALATLGQLSDQLKALDEKIKLADIGEPEYRAAREARDDAIREVDAARQKAAQLAAQDHEIGTLILVAPRLARLDQGRADLGERRDLPMIPEEWPLEAQKLWAEHQEAQAALQNAHQQIERLEGERAALALDPQIEALGAPLDRLIEGGARGRFLAAREDRPECERERDAALTRINALCARIGADPANAAGARLSQANLARIEGLLAKITTNETQRAQAEQEARRAQEGLENARAALERCGTIAPPGALVVLLRQVQAEAPDQKLAQAEKERAGVEAALDRQLARLAPWAGDEADLGARPPFSAGQVRGWLEQHTDLEQRMRDNRQDLARAQAEQSALRAKIDRLAGREGLISDRQAQQSRSDRDAAWAHHRDRLDATSADAFAQAMAQDDHLREQRLWQTDQLVHLRKLEEDEAATIERARACAAALEKLEQEAGRLRAEIAPRLRESLLPADFALSDLPDWLETYAQAAELAAQCQQMRRECDSARASLAQISDALAREIEAPDMPAFPLLIAQAQARVDALQKAQAEAEKAQMTLQGAEEQARRRESELARLSEQAAALVGEWEAALSGLWVAGHRPEMLAAIIAPLRDLGPLLDEATRLEQRIGAMALAEQEFSDQVAQFAAKLGADDAMGDPVQCLDAMSHRLREAQRLRVIESQLDAALAAAREQVTQSEAQCARAERIVTEMAQVLGTDAGITEPQHLLTALQEIAELRRQHDALDTLEAELLELLGPTPLEQARAMLGEAEQAGLSLVVQREAVQSDRASAQDALEQCLSDLSLAEQGLKAIGADADVAHLQSAREALLLEIEAAATRALRLELGALAADRALGNYRQSHRSEMLADTAAAFVTLTGGRYRDLTTYSDDKGGESLLPIPAEGGSKPIEGLSKGTRDQLYLALRVAGHKRFCARKGPLPFFADDILETFDDTRAAAAFGLLEQMARRGQVIYLTHHRHLCDIARQSCQGRFTLHEL